METMNEIVVDGGLATSIGETTEVSWTAPSHMTLAEWLAVGRTFQQVGRSLNFWTGDWLAQGEQRFGETYAQGVELTGHAVESLKKYKAVAERIPASMRRPELSWSHHFAVCYLPPEERGPLLDMASTLELPVRDLKRVAALMDGQRARVLTLYERGEIDSYKALARAASTAKYEELTEIESTSDDWDDLPFSDRYERDDGEDEFTLSESDAVDEFWHKRLFPIIYREDGLAAWDGVRVKAAVDVHGNPFLVWELTLKGESK